MRSYFLFLLLFCVFLSTPSCSKITLSLASYKDSSKKIFIATPKSNFVFDNIAPLVHKELTKQYRRIGYTLVKAQSEGFELVVKIISLTPKTKFISPNILLLHVMLELVIECTLFDNTGKELAQKSFSSSSLINKPRNSILRSSFLAYEYQKLIQRSAHKIEHYFRPFFCNNH